MRALRLSSITLVSVLVSAAGVSAQTGDPCLERQTFSAWLNCRIEAAVIRAAGATGEEKQAEPPSLASNSTSLLDLSSAPDFIGLGMTLFGINNDTAGDSTNNPAVSVTAYSLLALAQGKDIFDPDLYQRYANWRRLSFTLGQQAARNEGAGFDAKATIFGTKVVLFNARELSRSDNLGEIQNALNTAAMSTAQTMMAVSTLLLARSGQKQSLADFATNALSDETFKATLAALPADTWPEVERAIEANLGAQLALDSKVRNLIAEIKRRPQFSVAATTKTRGGDDPDEYRLAAIFDYGLAERLSATVNATLDLVDGRDNVIRDSTVGRAAGALTLKLSEFNPFDADEPTSLGVGADVSSQNGAWSYSVQFKIDIALFRGLRLPISVTRASRPDLVDEKEIRGLFGFTIDTSKLSAAFR
jgi:hypothetical protein